MVEKRNRVKTVFSLTASILRLAHKANRPRATGGDLTVLRSGLHNEDVRDAVRSRRGRHSGGGVRPDLSLSHFGERFDSPNEE